MDDERRSGVKEGLHPRNRFRAGYDFDALIACRPVLAAHVTANAHGDQSIDFADPAAVKALNQALLSHAYGLDAWDIPEGSLCPPVPGRSDSLHTVADLLASDTDDGAIPRGPGVAVLDIGTGANCIYPLIGAREYGWRFVATEADSAAWSWAADLVAAHPEVAPLVECRLQSSPLRCFEGVVKPDEVFDLCVCNPPFYASPEEAAEGNRRKRRNLRRAADGGANAREPGSAPGNAERSTPRNFGGQAGELWCDGGEAAFIQRMIAQSAERPGQCRWFTTLVAKSAHLPRLRRALERVEAVELRTLDLAHGQKKSRILAWTFLELPARRATR